MTPVRDTLWGGRITLWQPAQGYRFNLDPVLLAGFVQSALHVLDLGAGCGVLSLLLLKSNKAERVTAVEVQSELELLARRNAAENGCAERLDVMGGDLRSLDLPTVDAVVFNPPYFPAVEGRGSANAGRDAGRHERHGSLADFVAIGARQLSEEGVLSVILQSSRRQELEDLCRQHGLPNMVMRTVHPRQGQPANHVMLTARAGVPACREEPPLMVHRGEGRDFSDEVQRWVDGPY